MGRLLTLRFDQPQLAGQEPGPNVPWTAGGRQCIADTGPSHPYLPVAAIDAHHSPDLALIPVPGLGRGLGSLAADKLPDLELSSVVVIVDPFQGVVGDRWLCRGAAVGYLAAACFAFAAAPLPYLTSNR